MAEYINETKVLRRALYTYGSFLQIAVMMEEMSELQKRTMLNTSRCGVIDARDVGKTVFLPREEAENALEDWRR